MNNNSNLHRFDTLANELCSGHCRQILRAIIQLSFKYSQKEEETKKAFLLEGLPTCMCRSRPVNPSDKTIPGVLNTVTPEGLCEARYMRDREDLISRCGNSAGFLGIPIGKKNRLRWFCPDCLTAHLGHQSCCFEFCDVDDHDATSGALVPGTFYHLSHGSCSHAECRQPPPPVAMPVDPQDPALKNLPALQKALDEMDVVTSPPVTTAGDVLPNAHATKPPSTSVKELRSTVASDRQ